ncbi:MAG: hypothetical protein L0Z62_45410 [Gemmataceae bacterium]|nr:hypothetical protein [Gemmataceae bacterium]
MPYLVCVINAYRNHDPSTFASAEERADARRTMHYLFDASEDAAREHARWAHHTCCDWLPAHPIEVDGEPTVCPFCSEPLTWTDAWTQTPLLLRRNPMVIDPKDGRCRECRCGVLRIIAANAATMTVQCHNQHCRARYEVEHDAFADGGTHYYPTFMAQRQGEEDGQEA